MEQSYKETIDVYTHISPPKYHEALYRKARPTVHKEIVATCPCATDLEERFRLLDKLGGFSQVLSVVQPAVETVVDPQTAVELAKLVNDEMAELVAKHPDRFVAAVACLPMNDIDAALKEADRAITELGFRGVQVFTPLNGRPVDGPELMDLYALMCKHDLPIWLHPTRERSVADYSGEDESKYKLFSVLGWPYETSVAMARLVYSGVFDRYPTIKFIVHHCGAMIPFFGARICKLQPGEWLERPAEEYFKQFYVDTALRGSVAALACGYAFFGADHILFGTDMPREQSLRDNMSSIESLDVPGLSKKKIFGGNARELLRLGT